MDLENFYIRLHVTARSVDAPVAFLTALEETFRQHSHEIMFQAPSKWEESGIQCRDRMIALFWEYVQKHRCRAEIWAATVETWIERNKSFRPTPHEHLGRDSVNDWCGSCCGE